MTDQSEISTANNSYHDLDIINRHMYIKTSLSYLGRLMN
jgi:hypothetical protein